MAYSANNEVKEISSIVNKKLIEASGIIELKDNENKFVIKTGQLQAAEHYYLRGKELDFYSNPKELYLGLPKLWSLNNETGISKVRQYEQQKQPLIGVQALFIYPLNALINSQRECYIKQIITKANPSSSRAGIYEKMCYCAEQFVGFDYFQ